MDHIYDSFFYNFLWAWLPLVSATITLHYYYLRKNSVNILQNISIWVPWRKASQGFAYIQVCIQVSIFECGRVHYHCWHYDCSLSICCTCFGFSEPWRLNRETKHTGTVFSNLLSSPIQPLDWTDGIHTDRAQHRDIESLSLDSNR